MARIESAVPSNVTGSPRVLVIEDHADTRRLYAEFLETVGFEVFSSGHGEEALTLAASLAIDVTVVDLSVGFGFVRALAALPKHLLLIALTGREQTGAPEEALFDAYLVKPCLPEELLRTIQGALTRAAHDFELVSALIVSGAYCVACIARKAQIPRERVVASFRRIETEWREPVIDTARCVSCKATTTVYSLRVP